MHRYRTIINPTDLVNEYGMENTPKEIRYFVVFDQHGNAYIIPARFDKNTNNYIKAYEPEDILEAAYGDKEKRDKIGAVKRQLQIYCNNNSVFSEEWTQDIYMRNIEIFKSQYNQRLAEKGYPPVPEENFPTDTKTENHFPKSELDTVIAGAIYPPKPTGGTVLNSLYKSK
ncbi:MAG: hypothetical protein K2O89_04820 [Clostridia bacterium]|nr:hypothetical protein [Clostridia bacterium]